MLPLDAWPGAPPVRWEMTAAGEAAAADACRGPAEESRSFAMSWHGVSCVHGECCGCERLGMLGPAFPNSRHARDSRTYPNVVFQLDSPRGIELDVLQGLANHVVGLALACLGGLDGGGLVDVPLVVDVELTEGVGEREDVILLELRKFPGQKVSSRSSRAKAHCGMQGRWSHLWILRTFMVARVRGSPLRQSSGSRVV